MIYRPIALAAHHRLRPFITLRSLATGPFREENETLDTLLDVKGDKNTSDGVGEYSNTNPAPLAEAEDDLNLVNPPQAPLGSLPAPIPAPTPATSSRAKAVTASHSLPSPPRHFHLHVFASRNNTILTLTNDLYKPIAWVSAGLCGFKKVQRSGYEAGYQCAVRMFARIMKEREVSHNLFKLDIEFRGYGFGREAVFRALMASEGDKIRDAVVELKDTTRLKVGGGTKARKTRRL